jgi:outer membrane protein assembly factor BamB
MRDLIIAKIMPAGIAFLGCILILLWWFQLGPQEALTKRVPGTDRAAETALGPGANAKWEGRLIPSNGVPANIPGAWPCFRGPNRDGISVDETPLAKSWLEGDPKTLWTIDVGEGFAGAVIWNGRVFMLDYDQPRQADALRCLSLADGREIWRYTYPVKVKRSHGMSRTVPSVTDKHVVSLGPKCHVICVDSTSGELQWVLNLVREFNAEVPPWYAGQCPLIDGERVVLAPAGDALLIAVDVATGKVIWRSPNPNRWQMTHSSVVPLEFNGRRMYVYCASGGVAGISAADGTILWENFDWKISIANVPSPVPLSDGRIFLSGGYNAGSMMLQLEEMDDQLRVKTLFRLKPAVFGATQQTPILYQDHFFGIRPDGQLVCLTLDGKTVWESGANRRFGSGPFLIAQGLIYALNDSGALALAAATTAGYQQLAQAKILPGPEAWGPMALAGGRLIARDLFKMVCLDVAAK